MPEVVQEIVGYFRDRDVVDVQFVPLNEEEEEVEWALENGQFYGECVGHSIVVKHIFFSTHRHIGT